MQHSSIHWFRKGLRLHDNPALLAAATDCCCLHPLFILNPSNSQAGTNAQRFLLDALRDLDGSLQKIGSRLFVVRGCPEEVFPSLFHAWGTTRLTFEVDTEPSARQRDATVAKLAAQHGVEVIQEVSHTLYDTERVLALNKGKAPLTYKRLQSLLATLGPPEKPAPALTQEHLQGCHTPCQASHDTDYGVPNLEELGQDPTNVGPHLYPGGETAALTRLDALMERTAWVCSFQKPRTAPTSLSPSTTVLSPYLKFGCLSVRTFWWRLDQVYQGQQEHSQPPTSLHGQLLWREFFYTAGASIPNFDRMAGNPVCLQVDWDNNPQHLHAWREGQTGYPFIDAIMTQLRTEGWIHHLARHAVACFLTRGDLWVSWEEGLKVFEELLLDADWSLNAGNWLWLSGSAFFHQYFRVYSPVAFGKKTDRDGAYIRKYVPILKDFPAEYIYEPWKAPRAVQERAGCLVGTHYPQPIVEHGVASKRNLGRMKLAHARKGNKSPVRHQAHFTSSCHPSCLSLPQAPSESHWLVPQWPNHKGKSPRPRGSEPHKDVQAVVSYGSCTTCPVLTHFAQPPCINPFPSPSLRLATWLLPPPQKSTPTPSTCPKKG
ncbi:cryptochrome-2-like isoform X1 [Falco cherrug]|uniref:cryptochrome-2-like isoform X1 n=1 Tax=Falco cherrug TaxID=345164 RepID=UPI00247A7F2C|nr:cryptochrome-2-like isoform X1 [Falco cherrug]